MNSLEYYLDKMKLEPSAHMHRVRELEEIIEQIPQLDAVLDQSGLIATGGAVLCIAETEDGNYLVLSGEDEQAITEATRQDGQPNDTSRVFAVGVYSKSGLRHFKHHHLLRLAAEITDKQNEHLTAVQEIGNPDAQFSSSAAYLVSPDPENPKIFMLVKWCDMLWNSRFVPHEFWNDSNFINPPCIIERGIENIEAAREKMWCHGIIDGPHIMRGEDLQKRHMDKNGHVARLATRAAQGSLSFGIDLGKAFIENIVEATTSGKAAFKFVISLGLALLSGPHMILREGLRGLLNESGKIGVESLDLTGGMIDEQQKRRGEGPAPELLSYARRPRHSPFSRILFPLKAKKCKGLRRLPADELLKLAPNLWPISRNICEKLLGTDDFGDGFSKNPAILTGLLAPLESRTLFARDESHFYIRPGSGLHSVWDLENKHAVFHYIKESDIPNEANLSPELHRLLGAGDYVLDVYFNPKEDNVIYVRPLADVKEFMLDTVGDSYKRYLRADPIPQCTPRVARDLLGPPIFPIPAWMEPRP